MSLVERRGGVLAAGLAVCASLPALAFPFLSDDWHLVDSVGRGVPPLTAYDYFRPLYMATFWIDRRLWGLSPIGFHITNILLIACTTALVAVLVRRYTNDSRVAGLAALLFALHPYHVENAAWVAVRGDPLYSIPFLSAALAYDGWRTRKRFVPLGALTLYELAMLAKESAVILPALLAVVGLVDERRKIGSREWLRGITPFVGVAMAHFFVLRPLILGEHSRTLAPGMGVGWVKQALGLTVAAIVPVETEILAARPVLWGVLAASLIVALVVLSGLRARIAPLALPSALAFGVLLVPSIVGFQERYLFLPASASCLFLASLLDRIRGRLSHVLTVALFLLWGGLCARHWVQWHEAAVASRQLIAGLVEASRGPGIREIVVANMPFRVGGGSVAGDFRAALRLSGGQPVDIHAATYVSYPRAEESLVEKSARSSNGTGNSAEIRLWIPRKPFSQYVAPRPPPGSRTIETDFASVLLDGEERVRVRIAFAEGRAVYAWAGGRLAQIQE